MVNWKRPLTLIYKDNHKFGTGLYEPTLEECERRYTGSLGRTSFRSDRPDLGAFGDASTIGSSVRRTTPTSRSSSRPRSLFEDLNEQRLLGRTRPAVDISHDDSSLTRGDDRGRSSRRQTSCQDPTSLRDAKLELEELQTRVGETERAVRQDTSALRDIMTGRMMELATMLRDAEVHNEECQQLIRKQAQLMADLQGYCARLERKLAETTDEVAACNNRCKSLHALLDTLRGN